MDRFTAIWMPWTYQKIQTWQFFATRVILTIVGLMMILTIYVQQGSVIPIVGKNITSCDVGIPYIVVSGIAYGQNNWQHGYIYELFCSVMLRWIPFIFMVILNLGFIIAIIKRRSDQENFTRGVIKKKEKDLVLTMVAMITSYILFVLPVTFYRASIPQWPQDRCCVYHTESVVGYVFIFFVVIEYVGVDVIFLLLLNSKFRKEVNIRLRLERNTRRGGGELRMNYLN